MALPPDRQGGPGLCRRGPRDLLPPPRLAALPADCRPAPPHQRPLLGRRRWAVRVAAVTHAVWPEGGASRGARTVTLHRLRAVPRGAVSAGFCRRLFGAFSFGLGLIFGGCGMQDAMAGFTVAVVAAAISGGWVASSTIIRPKRWFWVLPCSVVRNPEPHPHLSLTSSSPHLILTSSSPHPHFILALILSGAPTYNAGVVQVRRFTPGPLFSHHICFDGYGRQSRRSSSGGKWQRRRVRQWQCRRACRSGRVFPSFLVKVRTKKGAISAFSVENP